MKVTFIAHSGFYIETESAALLFDYFKGALPDPDPGKMLFVFASHVHEDHFNPEIFRLADRSSMVRFILSDDIPESRIPAPLMRDVSMIGPHAAVEFPLPDGEMLTVRTFRSTDEGVAFLVDVGDRRIYHAGDLNNWHWDEENEEDRLFNEAQARDYAAELEKIAAAVGEDGHVPDLAFVPLDNRLGEGGSLGLSEYMEKVSARYVFPMHLFGDPGIIARFRTLPAAAEYKDRILGSGTKGESFELL